MNYGFGLYAALPDGTVIELPKDNMASTEDMGFNDRIDIVPVPITDNFYIMSHEYVI